MIIICLIGVKLIFTKYDVNIDDTYNRLLEKIEEKKAAAEKQLQLEKEYNNCLKQAYQDAEKSGELQQKEIELTTYLKKYNLSLKFVDINTNYTYVHNENVKYYAASTIKLLDALYIYSHAASGEVDLEQTMKYEKKYKVGYSSGMEKHKIGDMVSLRDLVKYAITVSDNTAHNMLVSYIGFKNLKSYGQSLGATTTLVGNDNFGSINVDDAIIYLQELYKFINENSTLGQELLTYFASSQDNYLKNEEKSIQAATKYGEYSPYFHNIGIVYTKNPYYISILTKIFGKQHGATIKNINNIVQELQNVLYENRKNYCQNQVYGLQNNDIDN